MLFAHSFSATEEFLFKNLTKYTPVVQLDLTQIPDKAGLTDQLRYSNDSLLLYSFQKLEHYTHIDSFRRECEIADYLVEHVIEKEYRKIILLTYPGSYFNSSNLFLQHKGIIEQKFVNTGIPCTLLNIQAIGDAVFHVNNLHELFYDRYHHQYLIPQRSNFFVYSIQLRTLVKLLLKAMNGHYAGRYDVFDTISDLRDYLLRYSKVPKVQRMAPVYLYFKSLLGQYPSLTMLELFLQGTVPMYKFRTEKEFDVPLPEDTIPVNQQHPVQAY
ncbi:MAG TPA: hypothetical protein PLP34_09870, partial [Chitinophagaceae bacterium]|nr:hypothetical protein [Chitinophagaceae bacterium]